MPYEVKLSQLQNREEFEAAVASHIAALKASNSAKDKPRPTAHPLVEACVKRVTYPVISRRPDDYVADYVIIDDTPEQPPAPPAPSLDEKKQFIMQQMRQVENVAKQKYFPFLKLRLLELEFQDAMQVPEADRTPEQQQAVAKFMEVQAGYRLIDKQAAQAEAALADLDEATIDSWQMPTFE